MFFDLSKACSGWRQPAWFCPGLRAKFQLWTAAAVGGYRAGLRIPSQLLSWVLAAKAAPQLPSLVHVES